VIHGRQTIELTYASVAEALRDWLQKHLAEDVTVVLDEWVIPTAYTPKAQTLTVSFAQAAAPDGCNCRGKRRTDNLHEPTCAAFAHIPSAPIVQGPPGSIAAPSRMVRTDAVS
jgi:hypothetical protein